MILKQVVHCFVNLLIIEVTQFGGQSMRLLLILILTSVLGACSSQTSRVSVATQFQPNTSAYSLGINHFKNVYYTVPKVAMQEYNHCVDFTLRELQAGEQCKWEVPGVAIGIVKLVQIDATGCHYMFNTMMYRNKQKNWQETACYSASTKQWRFQ